MLLQVWLLIFNMIIRFMLGLFSACASGVLPAPVANGDWVIFRESFEDITRQIHHCAVLMLSSVLFPTEHLNKSTILQSWGFPVSSTLILIEKVSVKNSISYLGRLAFFKSNFLFVWIKNYDSVYCSHESFFGPCVVQPLGTKYAMLCLKTELLLFNLDKVPKYQFIMSDLVRLSSWLWFKNCFFF